MRLLLLSFYYPPDLSAGSFRASALVDALVGLLPADTTLDVITTAPNRYSTFTRPVEALEVNGAVTIRRISLPAHRSDLLGQSRAFVHFARQARKHAARVRYDLVVATSSRLMTAALGAWLARRCNAKLYLDIRDIFVDTIGDLFPKAACLLRPPLSALERWTMRRADRINLVSRGFEGYFTSRYPRQTYAWFTNGIDEEFLHVDWSRHDAVRAGRTLLVVYAGNIGEGQGLHAIIPQLARGLMGRVRFRIIGDGGRRQLLADLVRQAGADNVEILPPMSRPELLEAYRGADVLFLHLNAHAAFEKVLPSKIFEYAATGKPIWAGVAGYAARFVAGEVSNAVVFAPCAAADAIEKLGALELKDHPRRDFIDRYARRNIAGAMAEDILKTAQGTGR